jgi:hypothetical protein
MAQQADPYLQTRPKCPAPSMGWHGALRWRAQGARGDQLDGLVCGAAPPGAVCQPAGSRAEHAAARGLSPHGVHQPSPVTRSMTFSAISTATSRATPPRRAAVCRRRLLRSGSVSRPAAAFSPSTSWITRLSPVGHCPTARRASGVTPLMYQWAGLPWPSAGQVPCGSPAGATGRPKCDHDASTGLIAAGAEELRSWAARLSLWRSLPPAPRRN